jgi:antitoxin YefM
MMSALDNKSAVLICHEEYTSMKETMYLFSSKNNSDRLLDSIEEIEKCEFMVRHTQRARELTTNGKTRRLLG